MFGFTIFLAVGVTLARAYSPPYVQSMEAFAHARTYVGEFLEPQLGGIHDPSAREHFSFGILAGVAASLVRANKTEPLYHPLFVVDKNVPYAWRNYKEIAQKGQTLLNEASAKVNLIEDIINNLCGAESVSQCNAKVHAKVLSNPYAYKLPAELMLLLGKASETIRHFEPTINSIARERKEIPYLINQVERDGFKALIAELENAYQKMRELHFRRSNPRHDII